MLGFCGHFTFPRVLQNFTTNFYFCSVSKNHFVFACKVFWNTSKNSSDICVTQTIWIKHHTKKHQQVTWISRNFTVHFRECSFFKLKFQAAIKTEHNMIISHTTFFLCTTAKNWKQFQFLSPRFSHLLLLRRSAGALLWEDRATWTTRNLLKTSSRRWTDEGGFRWGMRGPTGVNRTQHNVHTRTRQGEGENRRRRQPAQPRVTTFSSKLTQSWPCWGLGSEHSTVYRECGVNADKGWKTHTIEACMFKAKAVQTAGAGCTNTYGYGKEHYERWVNENCLNFVVWV